MKLILTTFIISAASLAAQETTIFPDQVGDWKMAGPGEFVVADGTATAKGGMGLWWYSKEKFENATLSLEFKMDDPSYNSGVFVRFPEPGDDPWVAVKEGYEVQISGRGVDDVSTGAIYKLQAAVANPLKPDGEWNKMEIHTLRNEIAVVLNNQLVNIFKTEKGRGDKEGYFGIQNHDDGSPVQFRNITVTPQHPKARLRNLTPRSAETVYELKRNPETKKKKEWFDDADFGPAFIQTWGDFYNDEYRPDAALKGMLLRPDPKAHNLVALYNLETMQVVTATDRGVSLDNTPFGGNHGTQNKVMNLGNPMFNSETGPAWADADGSFEDSRETPGHGNFDHLEFKGYFRHGHRIVLDYTVNGQDLLESVKIGDDNDFVRVLDKSAVEKPELLKAAPSPVKIVEGELKALTEGGPAIYPETFEVTPKIATGDDPFLVDQIPLPPVLKDSPYKNKVRLTDFDFFSDGDRAALCTWDGDVWLLSGLKEFKTLTWKRFAAGLFEPLGLKIVDDVIHLNARDGIWQVIDLNGDDEADHFKVFNYDVVITDNFHEFSFGLETDSEGNFYFAKASPVKPGGRNFDKILKHNGTFLKLTPDGKELTVVATGLRAPGGIGVGPNGELTSGENEGTWQPCCKLNYFTKDERPVFLGTEQARHEVTKDFKEPLCYFPMDVDNSGGQQAWIPDFAKVGLQAGEMLHLSYGQSSVYRVLPQELESGQMQGGVVRLPITLSSSAQRVNFHPEGSMYICGMRGWQTNAASDAGIQRVRYNEGTPLNLPEAMSVKGDKLTLVFDSELDEELATDPESFSIKRWKYMRTPQYGSGQFSIDNPDLEAEANAQKQESKGHKQQDDVEVTAAELGEDGKTIILTIPTLKPAQQMKIDYDLETLDGDVVIGTIYSTIHKN
ncbi:DUF1080 domain-containing protein [Roseibacillus persicicus]|uniref:DUF1080 domain-containing protein n=1 Tax=Roseibacillus persicicus TaxID=454148 RepID=UPI00280EF681|nr:DUF1080 domain-containing protein [Roseibacillus persicicus]MDQ8189493.1 DUF1080 domain-containing protein [Roseibacillus persicicus]